MPVRYFVQNPSVSSYLEWDGTNVSEFQAFFQREYEIVEGGLKELMSGTVIPLGQYFDGLSVYPEINPEGMREVTLYGTPPYRYVLETNPS